MTVALLLAVLALFDCALAGFRAAAGRQGMIDKRAYFRGAIVSGLLGGVAIVACNAALTAVLVKTAHAPQATWSQLVDAGTTCIWFFGALATATLAAMALWFSPTAEVQLLATVIVLGPFTLIRPLVIAAGLAVAAVQTGEVRVGIIAAVAGVTMLGFEHVLGRRYASQWRQLV